MKNLRIHVSEEIGEVSAILIIPEGAKALLILAHGAGADMNHTFMKGLASTLAAQGVGTLRFNFPYMERGRGRPDRPPKAHMTIRAVIHHATTQLSEYPLFVGGKSFGGRMGSQCMALIPNEGVKGLVFFGFPLHSPAKPGVERATHLSEVKSPMLFHQGDRDALARLDLLAPLLQEIPNASLKVYKGANHSFKFLKKTGINDQQALEHLAVATGKFIDDHL